MSDWLRRQPVNRSLSGYNLALHMAWYCQGDRSLTVGGDPYQNAATGGKQPRWLVTDKLQCADTAHRNLNSFAASSVDNSILTPRLEYEITVILGGEKSS